MKKSRNFYRHMWVDDGLPICEIYAYTCCKCGKKKIKSDFVSASYYNEKNDYIGIVAPECVRKEKGITKKNYLKSVGKNF